MRLPFGLGRRSSSGDGAESGDSDTGLATADAPSTPAAPGRAWASLPPIQRTAGDMPMVAEPGRFAGALPGSQGLPPIVQPLGHEVSALATPGLVVARARPVEVAATAAIPAPVQRRQARSSQAASVQAIAAPATSAAPDLEEPSAAEASSASPGVEVQPIRSMPTVSRQSVRVPDRPLTSAAMAARPAAVHRAEAAAAAASAGPLPPPSSGGMRRVPSASPAGMPVVSRQAAPQSTVPQPAGAQPAGQPAPITPAAAPALPAMPASAPMTPTATAPAPTRLGLGEPLSSVPVSARPVGTPGPAPLVSRSTTAAPMPLASSNLRPTAQRPALGPGAGATPGDAPRAAGQPVAQRLPELPHLPVARSSAAHTSAALSPVATSGSTSAATASSVSSASGGSTAASVGTAMPLAIAAAPSGSAPLRAVQTSAAPEIRPIAAANPIRPSVVIQRAADDAGDEGDMLDGAALPSPWWAPAAESRPAGRGFAGAGLDAATPSLQRSAAGDAGPAGSSSYPWTAGAGQPSRSSAAAPSIQRSSSPASRPLPPARGAGPDPGSRSTASVPAVVSTPAMPTAVGITSGPVVQTTPGPGGRSMASGQDPTVQRVDPEASSGAGRPSGGQSPAGSPGRPPAAGEQSRGHSDRDLDELAQALFSRIRTRLRSDLIHDREAKGLTFDNV